MKSANFLYVIIFTALIMSAANAQIYKLGEPLSKKEAFKVSEILNNPKDFVGRRVLVRGVIINVCLEAGNWIELKDDNKDQKIKVIADMDEFTFPHEVKNMLAVIEGKVHAVELSEETRNNSQEESDSIKVSNTVTIFEIYASGALIRPQLKNVPKIE